MTKRIVSGIFILTALGALGVILAGALTSGEQLIVRFLTAVIVAALGLYVISDLRLQADDDATTSGSIGRARLSAVAVPPNSTAAFMATVTKKGDGRTASLDDDIRFGKADDDRLDLPDQGVGTTPSSTTEPESGVVEGAGSLRSPGEVAPPVPEPTGDHVPAPVTVRASDLDLDLDLPELNGRAPATVTELFSNRTRGEDHLDGRPAPAPTELRYSSYDVDASTDIIDASSDTSDDTSPSDDFLEGVDGPSDDEVPPGAAHDQTGAVADGDLDLPVDDRPDDDVARPAAVIDFEYSGELQAPDYHWPAPPQPPSRFHPSPASVAPPVSTEPPAPISQAAVAGQPDGSGTSGSTELNGHYRPLPATLPSTLSGTRVGAIDYADAPLAPIIDLRDIANAGSNLELAIRSGEIEVIATLIEQGMLSTSGPLSDRDVRTMVYVAFTSNELRKLLLAGGRPDGPKHGLDLGPVELFGERAHTPAPEKLYSGLPEPEARTQLG